MQVSPVSISSLVPTSGTIASVLPKDGELPVNALLAPVEEVDYSAPSRPSNTEPDTYEYLAQPKQSKKDLFTLIKAEEEQDAQDTRAEQNAFSQEEQELSAKDKKASASALQSAQGEADSKVLRELKNRDKEVRSHEQAHMSRGGGHTGSASFTFQTGPDGERYAVGGEVPVDLSEIKDDPQATLEKMAQVQQAALAPAEPSGQDRQVAAKAGQIAARAMNELAEEKRAAREEILQAREIDAAKAKEELEKAKKEQKKADEQPDEKADNDELVSTAERFSEYNARTQRINQTLLELSMPHQPSVGQLLNQII